MMTQANRIFIVDDHTLFRAGIRALLSQDPANEVVGEASNGRDAAKGVIALEPDLVLMDISMPGMNGMEAIIDIKRRCPKTRIIVLTIHKTDEYIHSSLRAGASGYLLKDATHEELIVAVRSVLKGKTYLSPDISGEVIHGYLGTGNASCDGGAGENLTHRERQVLKLVAEGRPNKYIADYFCLSVKTVEKHRSNLMKKLDLHNAAMVTSYAIAKGLLSS